MKSPNLPLLAAQLARLQHMVPHNLRARLTTLNGEPHVEVVNIKDGTLAELCPATRYIEKLRNMDQSRNMRPKDAGTKQARTSQTRGATWR